MPRCPAISTSPVPLAVLFRHTPASSLCRPVTNDVMKGFWGLVQKQSRLRRIQIHYVRLAANFLMFCSFSQETEIATAKSNTKKK